MLSYPVRVALVLLACCTSASGQGGVGLLPQPRPLPVLPETPAQPGGRPGASLLWEPASEFAPAWLLALGGVFPYAELAAAGLPLPPSLYEVATLPPLRRQQEQSALKSAWLERLIGARSERNRVSRENAARSARLAQELGAPSAFVALLCRQAAGDLPARERYLLNSALLSMLEVYGVSELELRFFVEDCDLSPEELRELEPWLPLPALFNEPAAGAAAASASELGADYVEWLAVRRDLAAVWRGVSDRASADAAAEALLPVLARCSSAMATLRFLPEERRMALLAPYARYAAPVNEAYAREYARLLTHGWFGSARLQALAWLFRG